METQTESQRPNNGQLISVPHKDTIRLLEVFVKRSLSLNDGALGDKKGGKKEKWVTMPKKQRRHSSDPSLHLADDGLNEEDIGASPVIEPAVNQPETPHEESEKANKISVKIKKPSFWKNLLGIFYRKSSEEKDEEEDGPSETPKVFQEMESSDNLTTCLPTNPPALQKRKSIRGKSIKRRLSKRRQSSIRLNKSIKDLNPEDITRVEGELESKT